MNLLPCHRNGLRIKNGKSLFIIGGTGIDLFENPKEFQLVPKLYGMNVAMNDKVCMRKGAQTFE